MPDHEEFHPPQSGDPELRVKIMLARDVLRMDIHDRVKSAMDYYERTFNCKPTWALISFDLIHKEGPAIFCKGDTVCGLTFRLLLTETNYVEVGTSVIYEKA